MSLGDAAMGGGGVNPDDLLQQIGDLLQQYLALGPNTPVAAEAQQLSDAIAQSAGGAGDTGGVAPDQGGMPPPEPGPEGMGELPTDTEGMGDQDMMGGPPPDMMAPQPGEPPAGSAKTFGEANGPALERLKKRNQKSKA